MHPLIYADLLVTSTWQHGKAAARPVSTEDILAIRVLAIANGPGWQRPEARQHPRDSSSEHNARDPNSLSEAA